MKQVPWTIVKPDVITGTVWEKLDESKLNINFEELENIFSAKPVQ
jgi:hypothetical protein